MFRPMLSAVLGSLIGIGPCPPDAARPKPPIAAAVAAPDVDACALLTPAEIAAATGVTVTRTEKLTAGIGCNFHAGQELLPTVTIVLGAGMQAMGSSAEMAAWRKAQSERYADENTRFIIEPIEGLGAPAIRNEIEGLGIVAVESVSRGWLLSVGTDALEKSKALTRNALPRLTAR
jgi:hypothetical protein